MKITKQQALDAATSLTKPLHEKLNVAELALKEAATSMYEKQLPKQVLELYKTHSRYFRKRSSVYFNLTGIIPLTKSLPEFKQSIVTAFSHKVAKTIISNNDGLFDKVSNELKQDAIFKSKMQLATSKVVEECLSSTPSN